VTNGASSTEGDGPYLAAVGGDLRVTSMGNVAVPNPAYQGLGGDPAFPKTIIRDYGFGCTFGLPTVTIGALSRRSAVAASTSRAAST